MYQLMLTDIAIIYFICTKWLTTCRSKIKSDVLAANYTKLLHDR